VDFKNTILIMTSNIGAKYLVKEKKSLGFHGDGEEQINDAVEKNVMAEVKKAFNPEFLNRLDETILFQSLTDSDLIQIVELLVQSLNLNLAQKSITISVTDDAKKWILEKTLTDRSYGARPLRRALQRYVEDPLSEALIAGQIQERPAFLEVYLDANQLFYRPVSADENASEEKAAGVLLFSN
jgi:ATP-dependent Clp protease ATP-binding subunit ClpC